MKPVLTGTIRSLAGIAGMSALNSAMDVYEKNTNVPGEGRLSWSITWSSRIVLWALGKEVVMALDCPTPWAISRRYQASRTQTGGSKNSA